MFKFFSLFIVTCTLVLVGCEASTTPETVTTNEDDIARYEAMIEADQGLRRPIRLTTTPSEIFVFSYTRRF